MAGLTGFPQWRRKSAASVRRIPYQTSRNKVDLHVKIPKGRCAASTSFLSLYLSRHQVLDRCDWNDVLDDSKAINRYQGQLANVNIESPSRE